ncbi:alkylhydroperoxidase AhpD family core domain-containing protein [Saccharopolyspora antimicrobica]|uniref:AhpD family alkylhydroperoxidase n=1 Tax=Saccharopolyspora antimicrobica TaxID=455193 RepID=A0A1I4WTV1_9PSEU|nr:carboxymuconolactone decarboxylase family protein [Saccharopolyspora antimicrobica]RKT82954.1 AhpD family alkylhydroperoxidase [Saccharopolyspora antimicrobica]SFN17231.1 alkylhydroperoxidase AhpD family core domain-containing protein [Saccharopolyspora antimicrobica]
MPDNTADPNLAWTFRLAVDNLAPSISKAMDAFDAELDKVTLEDSLLELVRIRASQINGCAYCVDEHSREAHTNGESERRLFCLPAWREVPLFSKRERAALELTEAMTRLSEGPVEDELFSRVSAEFTDVEMAELIWTIAGINVWNRIAATARPWPFA